MRRRSCRESVINRHLKGIRDLKNAFSYIFDSVTSNFKAIVSLISAKNKNGYILNLIRRKIHLPDQKSIAVTMT